MKMKGAEGIYPSCKCSSFGGNGGWNNNRTEGRKTAFFSFDGGISYENAKRKARMAVKRTRSEGVVVQKIRSKRSVDQSVSSCEKRAGVIITHSR